METAVHDALALLGSEITFRADEDRQRFEELLGDAPPPPPVEDEAAEATMGAAKDAQIADLQAQLAAAQADAAAAKQAETDEDTPVPPDVQPGQVTPVA